MKDYILIILFWKILLDLNLGSSENPGMYHIFLHVLNSSSIVLPSCAFPQIKIWHKDVLQLDFFPGVERKVECRSNLTAHWFSFIVLCVTT